MEDCSNPVDGESFQLCKHLETIVGDIPVNISFLCSEELQGKGKSVCTKCPYVEIKEKLQLRKKMIEKLNGSETT